VDLLAVRPGLPSPPDLTKPAGAFWIGIVGALTPLKGQDLFLDAAARVAARVPAARFVVVGGEPYRTEARLGFGATLARYSETTGSPLNVAPTSYSTRFGLGLDYYLSENVALNFGSEFVVNTAKLSNDINGDETSRGLDYYSAQVGLLFKF
jgi:hypothetical protein